MVSPPSRSRDSHPAGSGSQRARPVDTGADDEAILRSEVVEERLQLTADDLAAILAVEAVKGFGPQKFRELHESGLAPEDVISSPSRLPIKGARGEAFRKALAAVTGDDMRMYRARAVRQLTASKAAVPRS